MKQIHIKLSEEQKNALKIKAKKERRTMQDTVLILIENFLKDKTA